MSRGRLWRSITVASLVFLLLGSGENPPKAAPGEGIPPDLERRAADIAGQAGSRMEEFMELAGEIAKQHQRQVEGELHRVLPETGREQPERTLIFITLGPEPEKDLEKNRRLLQDLHAAAPEAVLAVRGLPAGRRSIEEFVLYLKKLAVDATMPPLRLDPNLFRKYGISVAPTMVLERQGEKLAEVRGLASPDWLRRQVEAGRKGDLGQMGPTAVIAERDLIEELQERLWAVDWEQKKKQAYARYWRRFKFVDLPEARQERRFTVAATYTVPHDIVLPDGTVAAKKGDTTDLFKIVQPTFVLLIFDARKPRQVAWARATAREFAGKLRVKFIATALPDPDNGWQALENLEQQLEAPVYLLNEMIRERFQIKHVPALVQPGAGQFEVREICLPANR